jgi:signal transduction histidine kinase
MDCERLSLHHVLDIQQLTQLAQPLGIFHLALELLDAHGTVIIPSHCADGTCQQARRGLWVTVCQEGQAQAAQHVEGGMVVGVPIRPCSTALGVLLACQHHMPAPGADSAALIAVLSALVKPCHTIARQQLEIDHLTTEILTRYEQLTVLFDFGRHSNPSGEPGQLFELVTNKIAQLYGASYVINLYHKDAMQYLAVADHAPVRSLPELTARALPLCQHTVQEVYATKRPVVYNTLPATTLDATLPLYTAILAAPILVGNQWYGTLNILGTDADKPFLQSDIVFAALVAKHMGIFLANHRLYQRLEAAHQSQKIEAMGRLAGTIVHDFNNVLFAILGYGELAQEELPPDNPARQHLDSMLNFARRAGDRVQQILTVSRRDTQPYAPVPLIHVTQEVLALLHGSLPSTITLHSALPTTGCHVLGNSTQLHQVLMNLCTNAIHAMQAQGGSLHVHLTETDLDDDMVARHGIPPGTYVCLSVRDTGRGMAPEVLERIFEPFFTTKGIAKGTGVGLPVIYSIIQRHSGAITVASTPGQGTTFQVFLPLLEAPSTPHATTARAHAAFREPILCVDDNDVEIQVGEEVQ